MVIIPLFKDERELISKSIAPRLREHYNVRIGVRLRGKYSKLKSEGVLSSSELNMDNPLSPDIDILYWDKDYTGEPTIHAVEVKYFRIDNKGIISPPIYDGIGEALLLCTYGVDYVHLWYYFDPEISNETYTKYSNILQLSTQNTKFINYKSIMLKPPRKTKKGEADWLRLIEKLSRSIETIHYSNPLRYDTGAKIVRGLIKKSFRLVYI